MIAEDAAYAALLAKVERERGFRGTHYRQRCLRRRVAVRMRARRVQEIADYAALLDDDPAEYDLLMRVLTINVSKFFRNPETWDVIKREVVPELLRREPPLLIWSAGSAAGEEAYSISILVSDWLASRGEATRNRVRIIGTDIDDESLSAARSAEYTDVALSETPMSLRRRWFSKAKDWKLKEPVASAVEFQQLDVLEGRPDFQADLILCRNLLIYLDRPAQSRVFQTFVDVLRPRGYLVLGRVEMLGAEVRTRFEAINSRERIYRKL